MRLIPLLAVAALAGAPSTITLVAAETVAAVPAANTAFLGKLQGLVGPVLTAAQGKLDLAKKSALLPFAGASAKTKVDEAQAQVDAATALNADLGNLAAGKQASAGGLLAQTAAGNSASLTDRFKDIPGAQVLTQVLTAPGVAQALVSALPVDKVPGYATAKTALGL